MEFLITAPGKTDCFSLIKLGIALVSMVLACFLTRLLIDPARAV